MGAVKMIEQEPSVAAKAGVDGEARILVASRHTSTKRWAARWLQGNGFRVDVVDSVESALEKMENDPPDLLMADMSLRDGHGNSLCEVVSKREGGPRLPVMALCARDREVGEALEVGVTDVVRHPFNWQVAARRAGTLIRSSETTSRLRETRERLSTLEREVEEERQRIDRAAKTDPLTGLLTRGGFEWVLRGAMGWAPSVRRSVVVMIFDLDRFKRVNSTLGRPSASNVLQQVSQRLTATLRSESVHGVADGALISAVGRLEGDLFGVLLSGVDPEADVAALARVFQDSITGEYHTGDDEVRLSVSGAVAVGPRDGITAEDLIHSAELALEEARERGNGSLCFYERLERPTDSRSARLRALLCSALRRGELELHYQPLVEPDLSGIRGAEALLRWTNEEFGAVSPGEFIPLAEESGQMVEIGTWVLETACRQLRTWLDRGLPPITMAINLSLCQLTRGDLPAVVRRVLSEVGVPASLVELEISERGHLRDDPETLGQLRELKQMGVRLAVDDFGTGNSAIAYLKQFPFDTLKIDQSFVRSMTKSKHDAAITGATVAMAKQLDLSIIAEGVELQEQADFLRERGCLRYQGFLFSPAVPSDRFEELLVAGGREADGEERP